LLIYFAIAISDVIGGSSGILKTSSNLLGD